MAQSSPKYIILMSVLAIFVGCTTMSEPSEKRPYHHTDKGFRNLYVTIDKGLTEVFKMRFGGDTEWVNPMGEAAQVPRAKPEFTRINTPIEDQPQFTWVGHSTFLIQYRGLSILTDPMFSDRASPVSFAGPKRYTEPGIQLEDLPPIDIVVISHNHYDHLDLPTLEALGPQVTYVVPLKNGELLRSIGLTKIHELDWHESIDLPKGLKIHATPSQHWSARGIFDRRDALWAAFVFEWSDYKVFFGGDTGYTQKLFTDIGERYGAFDAALIPIGAYEPRWFMKAAHVNPTEAVAIHRDIKSRWSLGIHWGTFPLTAESPLAPPQALSLALQDAKIDASEFITLALGETRLAPLTGGAPENSVIKSNDKATPSPDTME